jgi:hypothetical protein
MRFSGLSTNNIYTEVKRRMSAMKVAIECQRTGHGHRKLDAVDPETTSSFLLVGRMRRRDAVGLSRMPMARNRRVTMVVSTQTLYAGETPGFLWGIIPLTPFSLYLVFPFIGLKP